MAIKQYINNAAISFEKELLRICFKLLFFKKLEISYNIVKMSFLQQKSILLLPVKVPT